MSGFASIVEGKTAKGARDGVLLKIRSCIETSTAKITAINGSLSLCPNEKETYTLDVTGEADQYAWEIPPIFSPNGNISSTSNQITLSVSAVGVGNISVHSTNACQQSGELLSIRVEALALPEPPVISKDACDRALSISAGQNIEWYRNGLLLDGVTTNKISVVDSGNYTVKINNQCSSVESDVITVFPANERDGLFFPNVITPNDDTKNDSFCVDKSLFQSSLKIFNRWGEEVYESNAYQNSWKGENVSAGIYFYYLKNACLTKSYKGFVQVIK